MGWSGSDFQRTHNFSADASAGINILASRIDAEFDNFETGLEACLKADGSNAPEEDFDMGGFKHTDVGAAASTNQYLRLDQFQQLAPIMVRYGGTAEAFSVSTSPVFTALVTGHAVIVSCTSANTTVSVTMNLNGLGAQPVRGHKGGPLQIGETEGLGVYIWNGSYFAKVSRHVPSIFSTNVTFTSTVAFEDNVILTSAVIDRAGTNLNLGFRSIPIITANVGRELTIQDWACQIFHNTASTLDLTIPTEASVDFPAGAAILIQNGNSGSAISVSAAPGISLFRIGTGSTGVRILSANCDAMLKKITSTIWYIGGTGLT